MTNFLQEVLTRLGYVFLEYQGNAEFRLLSPAPRWLSEVWIIPGAEGSIILVAEKSPFLADFLDKADVLLSSDDNATCQSEPWVERSPSGKEIPLQALALHVNGKRYLALQSPETQFKERAQLLQTARESLLEHEKLLREIQKKEILLHCIIHDLSQPLSVMSVTLDCLAEEPVSKKARRLLDLGKHASDQQMSMIRDILQVFSSDLKASIDAEKGADFTANLLQAARKVIDAFTPVFLAKTVSLRVDARADPSANWLVRGESTRLERIFSNLLENALRYAPSGTGVTIGLSREGEFLKAVVDDEGPGLPADLSPSQIFSLFSKGKETGGKAGLGLYFCQLTVERWGGAIGCESRAGGGSRFWFRLPVASQGEKTPAGGDAPREAATHDTMSIGKGPMRILLADDQEEIRILTTHQLERRGHHVVTVANGQKALEALQREAFDVILLDEQMPVMTGLETLKAIRKQEKKHGHAVVIALTGYNTDPDRERLLKAGFDGVIGKPFRMKALELMLRGAADTTQANLSAPEEEAAAPAPGSVADLLERVGGDERLLRKMARTFLRDTPKRLAEIQKAIRAKRGEKLAFFAHALKGPVGIFGAEEAHQHCQDLQEHGRKLEFSEALRIYDALKEEIAELESNLRGYAGQKGSPRSGATRSGKRRVLTSKRKSR
ncbi:MAG TPA: response regulator [Candidatus Limnocylindrales bacterium]|nr:response regulator [Candidatus Limnocylindrales bacterium]